MDINEILEEVNKEKRKVRELHEQIIDLQDKLIRQGHTLAALEKAKLKVCTVQLIKKEYEQVIQIVAVHETPDGLIIRVRE